MNYCIQLFCTQLHIFVLAVALMMACDMDLKLVSLELHETSLGAFFWWNLEINDKLIK